MNAMKTAFAVLPVTLALAACASGDPSINASASEGAAITASGTPRIQKIHRRTSSEIRKAAAPAGAKLNYYGGPVLQNVEVVTVFWNNKVAFQNEINTFYTDITNSPYFDWLNEYNTTGGQKIGRGSLKTSVINAKTPTSTTLDDTDIQTELARMIDAKEVPAPTANTLYAMHFPDGVNISLQGQDSCVVFCAYHNTFTHGKDTIVYSIIPDQGGACAGGCGTAANTLDNMTSVSSHELIEATTDPNIGLVTGAAIGAPAAWYDETNGEIGDICNADQGVVGTHTVQKEWSNKANDCILTGTSTTCTPKCTNKVCGDDGCGGSCGTCAAGKTCTTKGKCR
jgi:hypothetical protein